MSPHSCSLLPSCSLLKRSGAISRNALHRRQLQSHRRSRRHCGTCIEAKKKGQPKASKRFGHQTFEQSKPDTEAGNPGLTEYLKLGRAIGESPKEIEKNLRARGVPVSWDNTAEDYMQMWQDEEMSQYAAAEAVMSGFAPQSGTQSRANSKLQKLKDKVGVDDSLMELARQEIAAQKASNKRFRPLKVLKAKQSKEGPGVSLLQRPQRSPGAGDGSGGNGDGALLLSRPRPSSQDEVRWLQQAAQTDFDNEVDDDKDEDFNIADDDKDEDFNIADDGPPALSYDNFEALLNNKAPLRTKQKPPPKPPLAPTPQLSRPQGSRPKRQAASSTSSPAVTAPSLDEEDVPTLSTRPGLLWQKAPAPLPKRAVPQQPQPALAGRPARPRPSTAEPEKEQQISPEQVEERQQEPASRVQHAPTEAQRAVQLDKAQRAVQLDEAQRAVQLDDAAKQKAPPMPQAPNKPRAERARSGPTQLESPQISKPQRFRKAEEEKKVQPPVLAPLPALSRPAVRPEAAPTATSDAQEAKEQNDQAATLARLQKRMESKKKRQVRKTPAQAAAEAKAAAKAALPPLQLISPPRRTSSPSEVDLTNPRSWGLMDFNKFAAENSKVVLSRQQDPVSKQPPPPLVERPARFTPTKGDKDTPNILDAAEWQQAAVRQYAQRCMEAKRQLTVLVTGANSGGIHVRTKSLRGFIPLKMLSPSTSYKVLSLERQMLEEQGLQEEVSEKDARLIRANALLSLRGSFLTVSIINLPPGRRVVMTERPLGTLSDNPQLQQLQPQHLNVLQQNLGEVVEGIVIAVQYFGCFVEFDVEAEEGDKQPVFGMVHKSELSWDFCEDARLVVKTGQAVQAALMGVDAASGKVWLSMRQVLPDPLQETLEALLAQGPPGDSSDSSGGRDGPGQSADAPIAAALPQEQEAMAFPEALEVAEALVLLPDVDAVTPGRQMYSRAAAQDLQVYMSSIPLAELAASLRAEEVHSSSSDEEDLDSPIDAESGPDASPSSASDSASDETSEQQPLQSLDEAEKQDLQQATAATAGEGSSDEIAQGAEGDTLVVRKGQQLQELMVSGSITQEQLRDEVENIVSLLLSAEDL